ncbi:MAG TPA: hypothetical protein VHB21_14600, partial [Minicystis sp.]|nr:hypothetical protein [Minicystis sp.]
KAAPPVAAAPQASPAPRPNRGAPPKRSTEAPILGKDRHIVDKLVDNLSRRGIIPVFIEAPLNPMRAPYYSERLVHYYKAMTDYAAHKGALYWNWNADLEVTPLDFQDIVHLGSKSGRAQFQKLLLDNLADVLRQRFGEGAGGNAKREGDDG